MPDQSFHFLYLDRAASRLANWSACRDTQIRDDILSVGPAKDDKMCSIMEKLGWLDVFKGQRCTNLARHHLLLSLKTFALVNLRQLWTSDLAGLLFGEYIYIHDHIRIRSIETDAIACAAVGTLFRVPDGPARERAHF